MTAESGTSHRAYYRKDIDGLRAIAVSAVIVNHFSAAVLPGGYTGVDIFFAISGFVITASLSGQSETSIWQYLLNFYSRRIRRLWPGLLLCVAVTSIVVCLIQQSPKLSLHTGIFALFGVSNLYLLGNSGFVVGSRRRRGVVWQNICHAGSRVVRGNIGHPESLAG